MLRGKIWLLHQHPVTTVLLYNKRNNNTTSQGFTIVRQSYRRAVCRTCFSVCYAERQDLAALPAPGYYSASLQQEKQQYNITGLHHCETVIEQSAGGASQYVMLRGKIWLLQNKRVRFCGGQVQMKPIYMYIKLIQKL